VSDAKGLVGNTTLKQEIDERFDFILYLIASFHV